MNGYITKPVDFHGLDRLIGQVVPENERPGIPLPEGEPGPDILGPDREAALRRLGGNKAFLDRLTTKFVEDLPDRTGKLRLARAEGDMAELARLAHALKSAAATVGAGSCNHLAGLLESAAKENNRHETEDILTRLEFELKQFQDLFPLGK
jgi:HPt (histidine-containing phosphotransfer) domain-containing protein